MIERNQLVQILVPGHKSIKRYEEEHILTKEGGRLDRVRCHYWGFTGGIVEHL